MIYLTKHESMYTTDTILVEDNAYPQRAHFTEDLLKAGKSPMTFTTHVMINKLMARIKDYVKETGRPGRTALLFAAGNQSWSVRYTRHDNDKSAKWYRENKLPMLNLTNIFAGKVALGLGGVGHIATDGTACVSSLKVLMDVQSLIELHGFQRVIVMAGEEIIGNSSLDLFGEAGASLTRKRENEGILPSAFDSKNQGFYVGQGATVAVFEKEYPYGVEPIAKFLGAFTGAEYFTNPIGQSEAGIGYQNAINGVLRVANLRPNDIRLVKSHGTGTPVNNVAEKTALTTLLPEFVATSYKQRIGHTMGASGLLETGLMIRDINKGVIPAIANRTEDDAQFVSKDTPVESGVFLSLAAGMGNVFSAALFDTRV